MKNNIEIGDTIIINTKSGARTGKVVQVGYPTEDFITVEHRIGVMIVDKYDIVQVISPETVEEEHYEQQRDVVSDR